MTVIYQTVIISESDKKHRKHFFLRMKREFLDVFICEKRGRMTKSAGKVYKNMENMKKATQEY